MKKILLLTLASVIFMYSRAEKISDCHADYDFSVSGTTVSFFDDSETDTGPIISYDWDFGDGTTSDAENPVHTYSASGAYTVCLVISTSGGCSDDRCETVLIGGIECAALFTYEVDGLEVSFDNSSEGAGETETFYWSFGDGSASDAAEPTHTYDGPGIYYVCLNYTNEADGDICTDSICYDIIVGELDCIASFEVTAEDGLADHFFGSVEPFSEEVTYTWSWGDGTTTTETGSSEGVDPWHDYVLPGTYIVCLTIETESGCIDEVCHEIVVGEVDCIASFEVTAEDGLADHFFGSVEPYSEEVTYTWSWGDGTTTTETASSEGVDPWHDYALPGIYTVCLTIETADGCIDEVCHEVIIGEGMGDCSVSYVVTAEDGLALHFLGSVEPYYEEVTYTWSWGDGTTTTETSTSEGSDPWHDYAVAGVYTICLTIETGSGCIDSICYDITVGGGGSDCEVSFDYEIADDGLVYFSSSTTPGPGDVTSYYWIFGDGTFSDDANPHHTYTESGEYHVCLIVHFATGCVAEYCYTIYVEVGVETDCEADFEWGGDCLTKHFFDTSDGSVVSYHWDFGDGSTSEESDPSHAYAEPGLYTVCLSIETETGCADITCINVEVNECGGGGDCEAYFTVISIEADGTGWNVSFNNESVADAGVGEVLWYFGDGTTGDTYDAEHHYEEPGEYNVCVVIISEDGECTDEYCFTITVGDGSSACEAAFDWSDDGLDVDFTSGSDAGGSVIVTYIWSFDDGTYSFDENPTHTFDAAGDYEVCLTIIALDSCFDTHCEIIHIEDTGSSDCIAFFEVASITESESGWAVDFNNESTGSSDHFVWSYGDGATEITPDGSHFYTEPGIYHVCMTIGFEGTDCYDEYCMDIFIGSDSDCADESIIDTTIECSTDYHPVCGCDGVTYTNECVAHNYHGILFWTEGACTTAATDITAVSEIRIYPNPASNMINIILNSSMQKNTIIVMRDMLGNTVQNIYAGSVSAGVNYFSSDISLLSDGIYFITADTDGLMTTQKIIINK